LVDGRDICAARLVLGLKVGVDGLLVLSAAMRWRDPKPTSELRS
jgi:hypothetical protein